MYLILLCLYLVASIASQFLSTTPVELGSVLGVDIWLPLSAVTLIPLVDVLRSFTQDAAEKEGRSFKEVAMTMFFLTFSLTGICVIYAALPLPVFVGVLAAVTLGGVADVCVFRYVRKWFKNPAARMTFSNFAATFLGSSIFFFVAFTNYVFPENPIAVSDKEAVVGCITQSLAVWAGGVTLAHIIQATKTKAGK